MDWVTVIVPAGMETWCGLSNSAVPEDGAYAAGMLNFVVSIIS